MAVALLDAGDRAWLLFYDGDSVLPALVAGSLRIGQPQDWALSPVLFLPELSVFLFLSLVGLPMKATFIAYAMVSFVALYTSLRFVSSVSGITRDRASHVAAGLIALAYVYFLVVLDTSSDRNSLEVASLLATGTYYGATTIAMFVSVAVVAQLVSADRPKLWPTAALIGTAALSTLSNPIYVAWCTVPMAMALLLVVRARRTGILQGSAIIVMLALGCGLGAALRIPMSGMVVSEVSGYARPDHALDSLVYYTRLAAARVITVDGAFSLLVTAGAIVVCGIAYQFQVRRRNAPGMVIAAFGMVAPMLVVVGSVAMGTQASRYLAPVFFAPTLGLLLAFRLPRRRVGRQRIILVAAGAVIAISVASASAHRLVQRASTLNADVQCVVEWVDSTDGIGGGQFWTIRGPKAYLREPDRLVQLDHTLSPYRWLVNQADFEARAVSFVLTGPSDSALAPIEAHTTHNCGAYAIHLGVRTPIRGSE